MVYLLIMVFSKHNTIWLGVCGSIKTQDSWSWKCGPVLNFSHVALRLCRDTNFTSETDLELMNTADWTWLGYKMKYSIAMTVGFIIAYMGVFIVGIVGNALVILVVFYEKRMQSLTTNIFLVNLAFADLLVIVLCYPFTLIATLTVGKSVLILL